MKETKICSKCKEEKPLTTEYFTKKKISKDGFNFQCKICDNQYRAIYYINNRERLIGRQKELRRLNPAHINAVNRKSKYGVSQEQFDCIFKEQGSCCAACKRTTTKKAWCIDHDHKCCPTAMTCGNCIRGILCYSCNIMLGHCADNKVYLIGLIQYLEKHAKHS
jgi:hypothetical protein